MMKKILLVTITSLLISTSLILVSASADDISVSNVTPYNHGAGH